jgi:hypothetical protein
MTSKPIPQNPRFSISEDGTLVYRSTASQPSGWGARVGHPLHLRRGDGRYLRVKLEGKVYQVHVLVCTAFNGDAPLGKPLVLHRDDNPHNNHYSNLYWGSQADNVADARRNGRIRSGERATRVVLSWALVDEIRSLRGKESERTMAKRMGVSRGAINGVLSGRYWNDRG